MKKMLKILAAAAMIACGLMMTSCTEEEMNELIDQTTGPSETWCTMPITKKINETETLIGYVSIIYSDKGYTSTSNADGYLKNGTKIEAGITLAAWTVDAATEESLAGTVLAGLTKSNYVIKNIPKTETTITDGSSDSSGYKISGTKEKFTAIYLVKSDMRKSENQKKLPLSPTALANGGRTELTIENFSWKTLLKTYLVNSL